MQLSEAGLRANREYWSNLEFKYLFEADVCFRKAQDNNLGLKIKERSNLASSSNEGIAGVKDE